MASLPPIYVIGGVPKGGVIEGFVNGLKRAEYVIQDAPANPAPVRVVVQFVPNVQRPEPFHRDCVLHLTPTPSVPPTDRPGSNLRYFAFDPVTGLVNGVAIHTAAAKATSELADAAKLAQELEHVAYAVKQKQMTRADQIVELATGTRMVDARRAIDTIACSPTARPAVELAFPKGTYVAENAASADLFIYYHSFTAMPDPKVVAARTERGDCIFLVQCANAASVDQLLAKYQYNMAVQGVWSVESDAMRGAILACLARLNVRRHRPIQRPSSDTLDTLLTSAATRAAHLGIEHFNQPLQP